MGRNLLEAPIGVLLAQAADTRIHLVAMGPVRDAFLATGLDLAGLEGELVAAIDAGTAAVAAAFHAREAVRRVSVEQGAVCEAFARWCTRLRRRLEVVQGSGDDAVVGAARRVRSHLGHHPGRRFTGTLTALRSVVPELSAASDVLGAARWEPDLSGELVALLARAESAALRASAATRHEDACGRGVAAARRRLRTALRALRSAWVLAVTDRRGLPGMSLARLEAYAARGAAPDPQVESSRPR